MSDQTEEPRPMRVREYEWVLRPDTIQMIAEQGFAEACVMLERECADVRADNRRLREALRRVQWGGEFGFCPDCEWAESEGHAVVCKLGSLLAQVSSTPQEEAK